MGCGRKPVPASAMCKLTQHVTNPCVGCARAAPYAGCLMEGFFATAHACASGIGNCRHQHPAHAIISTLQASVPRICVNVHFAQDVTTCCRMSCCPLYPPWLHTLQASAPILHTLLSHCAAASHCKGLLSGTHIML